MTASIVGSIKNPGGDPLSGVLVKLIHEPTGSAFAKTSNDSGQYQFDSVKAGGPYHLSVNADDPAGNELKSINLKIDEVLVHDFIL
ncbi:MAG: carboxypeptidase-like regulatory domain-containing protein [Pseudomonadales bacterium]|jgi:hypothetical protein